MSWESVARRYARALFELGKEANTLGGLHSELSDLAAAFTVSDELRDVLDSPLVPEAAREALLLEVASRTGASELTRNAMRLLARRRRLKVLPEIVRQLGRLIEEDAGIVRARVTSAAPLTAAYLDRLKVALERATHKKVELVHSLDPTLLAGVVTQIGDQVVDGSARGRLAHFRDSLLRS